MDEAQIQALKIKINNIVGALNGQIQECDNNIAKQDYIIGLQKANLKQNEEMVVIVENGLADFEKQKNELEDKRVNLTVRKIYLIGDIAKLNSEMNDIKREIEQKTSPGSIVWDALNHIFNPIGALVSDILKQLYNDLNEKVKKVAIDQKEVDEKMLQISDLEKQIYQNSYGAGQLSKQFDILKKAGDDVNDQLKKCGIYKTNAENLKVKLQTFITHAQTLLTKCDTDKEILDYGINDVANLDSEVREFFNQNQIKITF